MSRAALLLLIAAMCVAAMAVPALAVEGSNVVYTGGTISELKEGMAGKLDMTSETALLFVYSGGKLEIPYSRIESGKYTQEVAVHLGVAPAIAVGLVKKRRQKHFVRITFKDAENRHQVVMFEVPKNMPKILMPALAERAPQLRCTHSDCSVSSPPAAKPQKQGENLVGGDFPKGS